MKLRGLTPHNSEMLTNLHNDVLEAAKALLNRGYFIKEEALIAAGERKHRNDIHWDEVREELEQFFGRRLASRSRKKFRDLTEAAFKPLKTTKDIRRYLENRGRGTGNETAGYCFMGWLEQIEADRLIANREHLAAGFHNSADRLRDELNNPLPPPPDELPLGRC